MIAPTRKRKPSTTRPHKRGADGHDEFSLGQSILRGEKYDRALRAYRQTIPGSPEAFAALDRLRVTPQV
jgi:hypothetical protein